MVRRIFQSTRGAHPRTPISGTTPHATGDAVRDTMVASDKPRECRRRGRQPRRRVHGSPAVKESVSKPCSTRAPKPESGKKRRRLRRRWKKEASSQKAPPDLDSSVENQAVVDSDVPCTDAIWNDRLGYGKFHRDESWEVTIPADVTPPVSIFHLPADLLMEITARTTHTTASTSEPADSEIVPNPILIGSIELSDLDTYDIIRMQDVPTPTSCVIC